MKRYLVYRPFTKVFGKNETKEYPVGTEFYKTEDDKICYDNRIMCNMRSEKAKDCLVGNDDGRGMERGNLILEIRRLIGYECEVEPEILYHRLMALWEDDAALPYNMFTNPKKDPWIWKAEFFCAPIEELTHIKKVLLQF